VLALSLVGVALGLAVTDLSPKVYAAHARLFVSIAANQDTAGTDNLSQGSQFALQRVSSYPDVVDSPAVLQPVIKELGLRTSVTALSHDVSASNPVTTVLLVVTVKNSSASASARIANAVGVQLGKNIERIETPKAGGTSPVAVTLINPAVAPSAPVSPRRNLDLALGLIVGLSLGMALAVLRYRADTTIKSSAQLHRLTGSFPLGIIEADHESKRQPLAADSSRRSEGYRALRTNLQFVDVDNPAKVFAVASSIPEEGKTTTACNLALTYARSGRRVCLVEADLRRPRVATYFGIERAMGLTNVLAGQQDLSDVLQSWGGLTGLDILPGGTLPPDPSELLNSLEMVRVLNELRDNYDYVIVDVPPLIPVTDGSVVARIVDGVILVVRYGHASTAQAQRALNVLETVGANFLGAVFTFVPGGGEESFAYSYARLEQPDSAAADDEAKPRARGDNRAGTAGKNRERPSGRPAPVVPTSVARGPRNPAGSDGRRPITDRGRAAASGTAARSKQPVRAPSSSATNGNGKKTPSEPAGDSKRLLGWPGRLEK
jgi:capsular exopolysaccharide synthesis family protein